MESDFYLGIVVGVANDQTYRFLAPTHAENKGEWTALSTPREEAFPNQGSVIWLERGPDTPIGSLWRFRVVPNKPGSSNHFRVLESTASYVPEILDLRFVGPEDRVREIITRRGLPYCLPASKSVVLWVADDLFLGPVDIQVDRAEGLVSISQRDLHAPIHVLEPLIPQAVMVADGRRALITPPGVRLSPKGQRDWADDQTIVVRVLKKLRRQQGNSSGLAPLTDKQIVALVEELDIAADQSVAADLDRQRIARARVILNSVTLTKDEARNLAEDLGKLEAVRSVVTSEAGTLREKLLTGAREDAVRITEAAETKAAAIEASARETQQKAWAILEQQRQKAADIATADEAEHKKRVANLREEAAMLQQEIASLQHDLVQQREALTGSIAHLDEEMQAQLQDVLDRPHQLLGELTIFQAAAGLLGYQARLDRPTRSSSQARRDGDQNPPLWMLPQEGKPPSETVAFFKIVEAMSGVSRVSAWELAVATLLAGGLPIGVGNTGIYLAQSIATSIAGGRLLSIPVSPAYLEPSDLFGHVNPHTGDFSPDKYGLLDLLLAAGDVDGLVVVCLEGINLAPIESYLLPILGRYRMAKQSVIGARIPICHPSSLHVHPRYEAAANFAWPKNVLLTASLSTGATTLPVPPDLWSMGTYVPTVLEAPHSSSIARRGNRRHSMVSLDDWESQMMTAAAEDKTAWERFSDQIVKDDLNLDPVAMRFWQSVYLALLSVANDEAIALDATVAACLLPSLTGRIDRDDVPTTIRDAGEVAKRVTAELQSVSHPLHGGAQ